MTNNKTPKVIDAEEIALAPIKDGSKYSLVKTPIDNKQLLQILQKTPAEHVYTRPGKGGQQWTYVTATYVKKALNYIFGWLWDFEIVDKGKEGDQVWVLGRLTVRNQEGVAMIKKEQFGRAEIKFMKGTKTPVDYGNDLKAAASDALKKCASELGIASDIYGKNEFKDIGGINSPNNSATTARIAPPRAETRKVAQYTKPATQNAVKPNMPSEVDRLKSLLFKKGAKTEKQALMMIKAKTGLIWKDFKYKTPAQIKIVTAKLLNK